MIKIGTYVHGGGNYEEKIIAIKNAGFDFVAIGMGVLSDGTLFTVFYEARDGASRIYGLKWRLSE